MSLEAIQARNKILREEGKLPGANGTGTRADVRPSAPVQRVPLNLVPCPFLGARLPGGCGSLLRRCTHFGDITTQFTPCPDANRCCQTCEVPQGGKQ